MAKSAEEIWLDALDSRENEDFDNAIRLAKEVVYIDEKNTEAWMAIAMWSLPHQQKGNQSNHHYNSQLNVCLL